MWTLAGRIWWWGWTTAAMLALGIVGVISREWRLGLAAIAFGVYGVWKTRQLIFRRREESGS